MGCINGAKIIIADALSRKQPATNMMTLKSSMTQMGESVVDNTSAANCVGAPVEAKIHAKADAPAVIKSNTPATKPELCKMTSDSWRLVLREINALPTHMSS